MENDLNVNNLHFHKIKMKKREKSMINTAN